MYFECTVKISDESIKDFLQDYAGYSDEEVEEMSSSELQNQVIEAVNDILGDHFSDYFVFDKDSIVLTTFD